VRPETSKDFVPVPNEPTGPPPGRPGACPEVFLTGSAGSVHFRKTKRERDLLEETPGADAPGGGPHGDSCDRQGRIVDLAEVRGYVGRFSGAFVEVFDVYLSIIRNRACASSGRDLPVVTV
jgi:hypothetical protein